MAKAQVKTQKQEQNPLTDLSYIKRVHIYYNESEGGIVISADIKSKSRDTLTHYTRIVLDPSGTRILKATCTCEGYIYRQKCWHIKTLKFLSSFSKED